VGTDVDSYENVLNQHFELATTLNAPCANTDILEALTYVVRSYPVRHATISEALRQPEIEEDTPAVAPQAPEVPEPAIVKHRAYQDESAIPQVLFESLAALNLSAETFAAGLYPRGIDESYVRSNNLFPQEKNLQEKSRTICTDVGKWARLHLYRTAFLTQQILKGLGISSDLQEKAKAATFLFSLSFAGENADLLRREYYEARHSSFRRDMCSKIKDSAMAVALELQAPEVGNLIATVGRLVGREEAVNDSPASVVASAIMAADITDRVCFQSGHWNPRRAYTLLKKMRAAKLLDMHPDVLCCVVKILTEAMCAHPHALLLNKHLRNDPKLKSAALACRDHKAALGEKKVALVNLMPGMRLSRPVVAYDGREILSSDIKLDQDLIWRLWQLSTVRPLNGPLTVFSKN
ncbi:MAG: hypothetical protein J0M12_17720, partial [Deltaproteobacteria bacterium]|nr:hypothetical protein [Deltaproteobacteria bacterium]